MKKALPLVYKALKKNFGKDAKLDLTIHDEVVVEHLDKGPEFAVEVQRTLKENMELGLAAMLTRVPAKAEVGGGDTWAAK